MSYNPTPREIIAQADYHRSSARAAESAMFKIAYDGAVAVKRKGVLGLVFPKDPTKRDVWFTTEETSAIHLALSKIKRDEDETANALEAQVTLKDKEGTR